MANLIDAPAKFLEKPGPPPIAWHEWKRQWDTYMIAIDGEQFSDKRKTALLLHSLGTEGQRRYSKLKELTFYPPSATEFEKTNLKLENEYRIIRNKRAERYTFRKRTQTQHESITEYIVALRDLASTCDFGDFLDDAICDQLIEKMNNHKIRERLLADENIDLDKAIVVAVRLESAIKDARSMEAQNSVNPFSTESVNEVRQKKTYARKVSTYDKYKKHEQTHINKCYRCGSAQHQANYPQCPALKQKCRKCKQKSDTTKKCVSQRETTFISYSSQTTSHMIT